MNALSAFRAFLFRRRRWGIAIASLAALYAAFGFLLLPAILKSVVPKRVGALLGREVSLQRVRTNPFTLSATLEGFEVKDRDGSPFLGWQRLYVNAQLWPLLKGQMDFKTIDLERPFVRIALEKGGRLNVADILDRLGKASPPTQEPTKPLDLSIGHLHVGGAELRFHDRSLAQPFATTLGPVTVDLARFRTQHDPGSPYSFEGRTEAGESFAWSGTLGTEPLRSSGTLDLENLNLAKYAPYYRDQVAFDLQGGSATAKAAYELEWSEDRHVLKLHGGSLALVGLALAERGASEPTVRLPYVAATGCEADLLGSSADIAAILLKDGRLRVRRDHDGVLNLQTLFTPPPRPKPEKPSEFKVRVRELAVEGYGADVEDLVPARPVKLALDHIAASVKDFTLEPDHAVEAQLSMHLGEGASFEAKGTVAPLKGTGDLHVKLEDLELPPMDSYLDAVADLRLSRGRLGLDGRLRFAFEGKKSDGVGYQGSVQISDFEARDSIQDEPFLRWTRLRLDGADVRTQRPSMELKGVEWTDPEARLVVARDGLSNVARALRLTATGPVAAAVPPSGPEANGPQPLLRIAQVRITGGRLSFVDRSIEPNAALLLSELEGAYTGLSTEPEEATQVDFRGKAGGLAPITIKGRAMPLRHDKDTDVALTIAGADLTDFSPYAGKYLGHKIREGKLDVNARVRIQERKLTVEDRVRLDHFFLGEKVESPDATHLPVKLGLALLRDRRGVIELDVPVDGSLDDPDIHYGKMVWKAILNVLGKTVTSPFSLLSSMFGGGEDLSAITFGAGSAALDPAAQKTLAMLSKALQERPELRLEVEGTADAADALALKRRKLEALLGSGTQEPLDPSERERRMRARFEAAFPTPKGVKVTPVPLVEVEQRLLDTQQVDTDELRDLAESRTRTVVAALSQANAVDAARIFEVQGGEAAKAGGSKVYFALK